MDGKAVLHVVGALLLFLGASLILPIIVSFYYNDGDSLPLLQSLFLIILIGLVAWRSTPAGRDLRIREGFAVVTFGWLIFAGLGCLPFVLAGRGISYTDAFFETMSGFTTTGATIMTDIESLPHGLLFWRSMTHWLGGMGIIVLSLAILPMLGIGGMQLFKAEVPGPVVDKLTPRIQDTAKNLWGVYVLLSLAETVLLLSGGMNLFDALCHTFGTMATGGFSTKNSGMMFYNNLYIQYVVIMFMIIAGSNFSLHYRALKGDFKSYLENSEFKFYIGIISCAIFLIFLDLFFKKSYNISDALVKSSFQVASLMTTTGFHNADYETWSVSSQLILVFLMFIGGCAGSTGGAIKVIRVLITTKFGLIQMKRLLHPSAILPVRLGARSIPDESVADVLGFFLIYLIIFVFASIIMSLMGLDIITSVSTVISTLGNIGPGIGTIGPTENYAHIPVLGKWLLSFLMLIGRLEIFTVLIIFYRHFWVK